MGDDECVVSHSQSAPWIKGDSFAPVTDTVLVYLNCNATVAIDPTVTGVPCCSGRFCPKIASRIESRKPPD